MATLQQNLAAAARALEAAGVGEPRLTAEVLARHVLKRERAWLYGHGDEPMGAGAEAQLAAWAMRRAAGEPLQYITGEQEFMGRAFQVSPAVLIPRPETELVVEAALEVAAPDARIADIGTGSGCIAVTLALERPHAQVVATDLSAAALAVARANARSLGAELAFAQCDLLTGVGGEFDLIVSNPPYVAQAELAGLQREVRDHEPQLALVAGPRGDEVYARIAPQAAARLRSGGWLVLELGFESEPMVRTLLDSAWTETEIRRDLRGWARVLRSRRI